MAGAVEYRRPERLPSGDFWKVRVYELSYMRPVSRVFQVVVSASIHIACDIELEQLPCQLDHKKLEDLDITYYQRVRIPRT